MTKYELQPYTKDGEVRDVRRRLPLVRAKMLNPIKNYLSGLFAVDVGCGNGRMGKLLKEYFSGVIGVDCYRKLDPYNEGYYYKFYNCGFLDMPFVQADLIFFFGSFYQMNDYTETLNKCKRMVLSQKGKILIIDDAMRKVGNPTESWFYDLDRLIVDADLIVIKEFLSGRDRITLLSA
jgi:ubiquinone/menaquinone biosynthesis C-methylase UbiE